MKKPGSSSGKQPRQHESLSTAKLSTVDPSVLGAYRELQQPGGPDFVTELIDLFLDDTTSQLKGLRTAVSKNDRDEIRRVAHLLKGSSGNIGAGPIAKLYEELEEQRDFDNEVALTLLARIEVEFELVREALETEREDEKL
jgi:two-component system sensor histidine kinase/response regulator